MLQQKFCSSSLLLQQKFCCSRVCYNRSYAAAGLAAKEVQQFSCRNSAAEILLESWIPDSDLKRDTEHEMELWKNGTLIAHSSRFSVPRTKAQEKLLEESGKKAIECVRAGELRPHEFWMKFGSMLPNLCKVALKLTSLLCTSASCERNFSLYERTQGKKRVRLGRTQLDDLVFCNGNLRMASNRLIRLRNEGRVSTNPEVWLEATQGDEEESGPGALNAQGEWVSNPGDFIRKLSELALPEDFTLNVDWEEEDLESQGDLPDTRFGAVGGLTFSQGILEDMEEEDPAEIA
jgi:hypothetical protein